MKPKAYFTPQRMTRIALLAAISAVLYLPPFSIPVIGFYKLDLSNLPVLLGGFSMGPVSGLMILGIKSLSGLIHTSTGGVGELADFMLGAALMLPAVFIYRMNKNRKSALIGMVVGTVSLTVCGVLANAVILIPFYVTVMHFPMEAIVKTFTDIIPYIDSLEKVLILITAPFNILKGVVLSAVTFLLYRHLSPVLHGRGTRA